MKNILVTGSNGFVGSSIVHELAKKNNIIGCGTRAEAAEKEQKDLKTYVQWDIAHEECPEMLQQMEIDVIIHAAACLDKNDENPELVMTNCLGTHRIYQLAREKQVSKVFYISGSTVIGVPKTNPVTEEHEINPQSMYLATKMAGEMILNQLVKTGIQVIHLRVPSPIGPGMPEKTIVPIFLKNAMQGKDITLAGKGSREQNYLDVRDLAEAIQNCLDTDEVCGTFNIGADQPVSNLRLAQLCVEAVHSTSKVGFSGKEDTSDGQIWNLDCSRLKAAVGYRQRYTIEQSLKDIVKGMELV